MENLHMISRFRLIALAIIAYTIVMTLTMTFELFDFESPTDKVTEKRHLSSQSDSSIRVLAPLPKILPMITGSNIGRLGNQMFVYAGLYGLAKRKNRRPVLAPRTSSFLKKYFRGLTIPTLSDALDRNTSWENRAFNLKDAQSAESDLVNVKYAGFPESWKYFHEFRENLLTEFQFRPKMALQAKAVIRQAKDQFYPPKSPETQTTRSRVVVVGIHVRRADFVREAKLKGFVLPGKEFFAGAMTYFAAKFQNVVFLVASDGMDWCIAELSDLAKSLNVHFLVKTSRQDGAKDLAILAHCDHVIFGVGTFGFWAAYLSPGPAIFCSDCVLSNSSLMGSVGGQYSNFVLPTWIGFSRNGTQSASSNIEAPKNLSGY